jgi:hypothetical protein
MEMKITTTLGRTAIITSAMIAALGTATATANTTPSTKTPLAPAASCFIDEGPRSLNGRAIYLWYCDESGWHGQIANASWDDGIWLNSQPWGGVVNKAFVEEGRTSADTASVGGAGSPWRACGYRTGTVVCTPWGDGR